MLAAYTGHETLTFTDYVDLETGKTLTAEPGRTYDVAPASGRLVPDLPGGWFTPVKPPGPAAKKTTTAEAKAGPAEDPAAEAPQQN